MGRKVTQMSPAQIPTGPSSSPRGTSMNSEGPTEGSVTTTDLDDIKSLFLFSDSKQLRYHVPAQTPIMLRDDVDLNQDNGGKGT